MQHDHIFNSVTHLYEHSSCSKILIPPSTPVSNVKMGLLPLEFTDCLQDSPYFRDSLHSHEKELERTSQAIKELIKEVKTLLSAAKSETTTWQYEQTISGTSGIMSCHQAYAAYTN